MRAASARRCWSRRGGRSPARKSPARAALLRFDRQAPQPRPTAAGPAQRQLRRERELLQDTRRETVPPEVHRVGGDAAAGDRPAAGRRARHPAARPGQGAAQVRGGRPGHRLVRPEDHHQRRGLDLSPEEIRQLVAARGGYVRMEKGGVAADRDSTSATTSATR